MTWDTVCKHCGVYESDHNYEHMATECLPNQIEALERELEKTRESAIRLAESACMRPSLKEEIAMAIHAERHRIYTIFDERYRHVWEDPDLTLGDFKNTVEGKYARD